jgi:3-methyl-2-oxobutanoate hydroxymethyltransferase
MLKRASPTVHDLRQWKGRRKLLEMHVDDELEAAAADAAGIDILTCEVEERLPQIRAAAPRCFIQTSGRSGWIASEEGGIREGFRAMELGADAIYFPGSLRILEAMAREGIPVTGHVGLVPSWATWTSFRAVGKTAEEAAEVFRKLKSLESAGAWAVEVEVVPVQLAAFLTANTSLVTEGMGCGTACDTIYLFSCDVLGTNTGHVPRHSKQYADMAAEQRRLHDVRTSAFRAFGDDVRTGAYPEPRHQIDMDAAAYEEFLATVSAR